MSLSIQEGAPTFTGGTINLGTGGGITVAAGAGNPTISSNLALSGAQTVNIATGRTLALNTGTFSRGVGTVVSLPGAGSVTSTMTGLSSTTAGIVGPWMTVGTSGSTRYATLSGSTITPLTGTAAATPAAANDTTGLANYDLAAANGTFPATVSANTLRFTGVGGGTSTLGATSFTVNGLLNAGTSTSIAWNLVGSNLTIGASKELVINAATGPIAVSPVIRDNGAGASGITVTGSNTVLLGAANTYTGPTMISGGTLSIGRGTATGSISPSSSLVNHGVLLINRTDAVVQGVDFPSVISGNGPVVHLGTGSLTLNGANTFLGTLSVQNGGTLIVPSITDRGLASPAGAGTGLSLGTGTFRFTGSNTTSDRSVSFINGASATIDIPANRLTLTGTPSPSASTASLTKTGNGTLGLGAGNVYSGGTTVSAGTLLATNPTGSAVGTGPLSVAPGAVLSGTGIIALGSGANASIAGLLEVGDSTLAVPVASTFQLTTSGAGTTSFLSGSTIALDLLSGAGLGDNSATATAVDRLKLAGTLSLASGVMLEIQNRMGLTNWAAGDRWKIFDWTSVGSITGSISEDDFLLPALPSGLAWDTTDLFLTSGPESGTLSIISAVPEPGTAFFGLAVVVAGGLRRRRL